MASLGEPEKYKTDHEQRDCYPNIGVVYSHRNETKFFLSILCNIRWRTNPDPTLIASEETTQNTAA